MFAISCKEMQKSILDEPAVSQGTVLDTFVMQLDIKLPGCELFEELQLTQSYSRSFIIALIRLFKNIKQMLHQHQHCHATWTEYLT